MRKKIVICVLLLLLINVFGCSNNLDIIEEPNFTGTGEEVVIDENTLIEENIIIYHPLYDDSVSTLEKYEFLKHFDVLPEDLEEGYIVNNYGEALNYAFGLVAAQDDSRERTEEVELTVNRFLEIVVNMLDYDTNAQVAKEQAQELGIVGEDVDVSKPLDYKNLVDILYNATFVPVNYEVYSEGTTPLEIISNISNNNALEEMFAVDIGGIDVDYVDSVNKEGYAGDVYVDLNSPLVSEVMKVVGEASKYYTIIYKGNTYSIRPTQILEITDELGRDKDKSITLLRVNAKFEVTGNNETYETDGKIFISRDWDRRTIMPYKMRTLRTQVATVVLNKGNYKTSINSPEFKKEEGVSIVQTRDDNNNVINTYKITYDDGVTTIIIEEIDL